MMPTSSSLKVNYTIASVHFRSQIAEKDEAFVAFLPSRTLLSANLFHRKFCGSLWFFIARKINDVRIIVRLENFLHWPECHIRPHKVTNVESKFTINLVFRLCMSRSFAKFYVNTRIFANKRGLIKTRAFVVLAAVPSTWICVFSLKETISVAWLLEAW